MRILFVTGEYPAMQGMATIRLLSQAMGLLGADVPCDP
jgi:hypothetical protein